MPPFLEDHPGYLGWTSQGLVVLHANWPTYPAEYGWRAALTSLGQFPVGARLLRADDIDRCFLLKYADRVQTTDPFDARLLHVAIWHDDATELHTRGLISGAFQLTLAEWVERRCRELEDLYIRLPNGDYRPVRKPSVEDFGDDEESLVLMIHDVGLSVTERGWRQLETLLADERSRLHQALQARAIPVVEIGHLDTAVREACVLLESRLNSALHTDAFGQQLVDHFIAYLRQTDRFIAAQLKVLHVELRTAFKFVRNPFMHSVQELTPTQCYAILGRVSAMLTTLDQIEAILRDRKEQ